MPLLSCHVQAMVSKLLLMLLKPVSKMLPIVPRREGAYAIASEARERQLQLPIPRIATYCRPPTLVLLCEIVASIHSLRKCPK